MLDEATNLFLSTYFTIESIADKLITNEREFFDKLFPVFLLPKKTAENLFYDTQDGDVKNVKTYDDANEYMRVKNYLASEGECLSTSEHIQDVINTKCAALDKLHRLGCDETAKHTPYDCRDFITQTAAAGLVPSLLTLGFLEYEGIFFEQDKKDGLAQLECAAKWNDVAAVLMLLFFEPKRRDENLNRLYAITDYRKNAALYESAKKAYNKTHKPIAPFETDLILSAFTTAEPYLKPDYYDSLYDRIIYSEVLTEADKERVLYSRNKNEVSTVADLPLDLKFGKLSFCDKPIKNLPLPRADEKEKICRFFNNVDIRGETSYRPLCITGENYIMRVYRNALKQSFPEAHVGKIDVGKNNSDEVVSGAIFAQKNSTVDEEKQNVCLLRLEDELPFPVVTAIRDFLRSTKRRQRSLPCGVALDLSSVLPVCFCDSRNAALLNDYCTIVNVAPIKDEEKPAVIDYELNKNAERSKIKRITVDDDGRQYLLKFPAEKIASIIANTVNANYNPDLIAINEKMLREAETSQSTKIGFGIGM